MAGFQDIARRYATAFFDLAAEQSVIDQIEKDMGTIEKLIASEGDFTEFLNNATLKRADQAKALVAIAKHLSVSPLTEKMLGVLATKRRLPILSDLVIVMKQRIAEHKGEVTADVTAAHALDQAQLDDIAKQLKTALGQDVRVNLHVDETIMGGLVIKVGSRMVDASVKTKLDNLHRQLKNSNNLLDQKKMKEVA